MPTNRTVTVDVRADISDFNRKMLEAAAASRILGQNLDSSRNQMAGLIQAGLAVGPALVGIGAAATPAIAGLTNQFALATAAAGVTVLAFQGVGDALKALNDQAVDPSDAHLKKLAQTMNALGPAGQQFVVFLQELRPAMQELQNVTQANIFPGIEEGITSLMSRAPEIERLFGTIAHAVGDLVSEAGANLADSRWDDFFTFLQDEARPTLIAMGRTLGNFTEGFAELWMAFRPLESDFTEGFLNLSRSFAEWADQLGESEGFQSFVDYVERVGPKAADAIGSITDAFVALVQAAAPVGELSLPILENLFDILSAFLRTPFGPPLIAVAAGLGAISTALRIANFAQFKALFAFMRDLGIGGVALGAAKDLPKASRAMLDFDVAAGRAGMSAEQFARRNDRLKSSMRGTAKAAGFAGGLAFVMTGLDDKMSLTHTASLALAGSLAGPWGTAIGAGVGLAMDFAAANDNVWAAVNRANSALSQGPQNIEQQEAAYKAAGDAIAKFKKDIGEGDEGIYNPFKHSLGDLFAREKNLVEGVFGSSDVEELEAAYSKQGEALRLNQLAARDAALAEAGFGTAMIGASEATKDETYSLIENIRLKNQASEAALNAFSAETAYRQALKDAKKQADSNNAGIKGSSDAALKNREALAGLATAWDKLAAAGGQTKKDLDKARQTFIDVAVAMGVPRKEAEKLANQLLNMPDARPVVEVAGLAEARKVVKAFNRLMDSINPFKRVTIITEAHNPAAHGQTKQGYTGMRIPPGFAGGGIVPGTAPMDPTVDNVWAMGANTGQLLRVRSGEWIINETQSRANDSWLAAINAGLNLGPYPKFAPSYATGGQYGGDGTSLGSMIGELTITNWDTGTGHFRIVAASEARSAVARNNYEQDRGVLS